MLIETNFFVVFVSEKYTHFCWYGEDIQKHVVVTGGAEIKMFPASKLQVQQKCMKLQKHFKNKYKKKKII